MNVQDANTFNAAQLILQDAYRVHKINTDFARGLYAGLSQIALIKIAAGGLLRPEAWQQLCAGIDVLTGRPLAEMEVEVGPSKHSVPNILAMLARMSFDWTPRPTLFNELNIAITRTLFVMPDDKEHTAHDIDIAISVFNQIAMQMANLIAEWLLVGKLDDVEGRRLVMFQYAEAAEVAYLSTITAYIGEREVQQISVLARASLDAWAQKHHAEAVANPAQVNGVIPFNAVLLGVVFRDIEKAEELLLCSTDVLYNPEYKDMRPVDRDYIYFHRAMGRLPSEG